MSIKGFFQKLTSKGMSSVPTNYSGWTFLGDNISDCGDLVISLNTYYRIQRINPTAQSMKDLVARKAGAKGMYLMRDGEVMDDERSREALDSVMSFFSTPTFEAFKQDYFTHYFASGQIYIGLHKTMIDNKAFVVDTRTMTKKIDDRGNVVLYQQRTGVGMKEYDSKSIYNHIVKKDPDSPYNGMSKYEPVVWDALSSEQISKRNYYFFQNNARPDIVVMMKSMPNMKKDEYSHYLDQFEQKYSGSKNAHKTIASNQIEDIKVLEMNHKDLQLLELDTLTTKKIGMIYGIDPRLLGFSDDVGAYATMNEIGKHSADALTQYQHSLEIDMNNSYRKFIDPDFEYKICLSGESFENEQEIQEGQRRDIELSIITPEEARKQRGLSVEGLPEGVSDYYIKNNLIPIGSGTENRGDRT